MNDEPKTNSREDLGYAPPAAPGRTKTMAKNDAAKEPEEEGTRSFSVLLQQVGDGDLHHELGLKVQELVAALTAYSDRYQCPAKGSLTLTLNFNAMGNGSFSVSPSDIKTKTPTAKRTGSIFWSTAGNNLSVDNPRQQKLPLREVPASTTRTKDLSTDAAPVRGV